MKKNDYILICIIVAAAAILFAAFALFRDKDAGMVRVTVDGVERGRYSLSSDREIDINGTNTLIIRDGKADMTEADCPDQLCVKQNAISKAGESIVCLPNKVVVTVTGNDDGRETDAVAN